MSEISDLNRSLERVMRRLVSLEERAYRLERRNREEREEYVDPIPSSVSCDQLAAAVKALGINLGTRSLMSLDIRDRKVRLQTVSSGPGVGAAIMYTIPIQ